MGVCVLLHGSHLERHPTTWWLRKLDVESTVTVIVGHARLTGGIVASKY